MKLFYRARHAAEQSHPTRRRASTVLPLALAFALMLGSIALADNLDADGDGLTTGLQPLSFENVCPESVTAKNVLLAIRATGHPGIGTNNFASGSTVSVTRGTISNAALSANSSVGNIPLPSNWLDESNGTMSAEVTSGVTLTAPSNSGTTNLLFSATMGYSASGPRSDAATTLTRTATLLVTATVLPATHVSCSPPPPPNTAPTVLTAALDAIGNEGDSLFSEGAFSDSDSDPLTLTADNAIGTFTDNLDGTWSWSYLAPDDVALDTIVVTADDGNGGTVTDDFDYSAANVDPSIDSVSFQALTASCGADNATLSFAFTDPGVDDTHTISVDWGDGIVEPISGSSASHTYGAAGVYTATLTVTDDDGGSDSDDTASITINYTIVGGGVHPPIKADGSSVFKYGSTVPVKVKIQDCDGSYAGNLAPQIKYQKMNGTTPSGDSMDVLSTSGADTTGVMRFTGAPDYQYIYNLATKSLPDATATYRVVITIPGTGQVIYSANWGTK